MEASSRLCDLHGRRPVRSDDCDAVCPVTLHPRGEAAATGSSPRTKAADGDENVVPADGDESIVPADGDENIVPLEAQDAGVDPHGDESASTRKEHVLSWPLKTVMLALAAPLQPALCLDLMYVCRDMVQTYPAGLVVGVAVGVVLEGWMLLLAYADSSSIVLAAVVGLFSMLAVQAVSCCCCCRRRAVRMPLFASAVFLGALTGFMGGLGGSMEMQAFFELDEGPKYSGVSPSNNATLASRGAAKALFFTASSAVYDQLGGKSGAYCASPILDSSQQERLLDGVESYYWAVDTNCCEEDPGSGGLGFSCADWAKQGADGEPIRSARSRERYLAAVQAALDDNSLVLSADLQSIVLIHWMSGRDDDLKLHWVLAVLLFIVTPFLWILLLPAMWCCCGDLYERPGTNRRGSLMM